MVSVLPGPCGDALSPMAALPEPRGALTAHLFEALRQSPHDVVRGVQSMPADDEEDLHLALYCCYELHYRGFEGVEADWEWEPSLLALCRRLEDEFHAHLRHRVGHLDVDPQSVIPRLWDLATRNEGPSLSAWVADDASLQQVRELAVHRAPYQLKEADPHTWGIPRLTGRAKAAMVTIQADEYGNGTAGRMHSSLFAQSMTALGLDPAADYLDQVPGITLATTNLISMLGLHRKWIGALVGHLALFEMTSVEPMTRYGHALRRLGVPEVGCRFYDVHVEADRSHQHVAVDGMVAGLLEYQPHLAADVIFGAAALTTVEARFSRYVLERWRAGISSLRRNGPS